MAALTKPPKGWASSRIGDVVDEHIEQGLPRTATEFTYVDISAVDNRNKEVVTPKKLHVHGAPSRARQRIKSGDVLVSTTRPNLNAVALVPPDLDGAIASTGFAVLRPIEVEPHWLFTVVQSEDFVSRISSLVRGALYPAVRPRDVHNYVMPVPPLAEQKRIVSKLGRLLARERRVRESLEALPALIQEYRAAVLQAACTGSLTADWLEGRRAKRLARSLPATWQIRTFEEVIASSVYGPRFSAKTYSSDGVPTIRTTDMGYDGSIVLTDAPRIKASSKELGRFGLQDGDLLVTRTGATIGKCALYNAGLGPAIPGAYLIRFRLRLNAVVPKFVLIFFMSPTGQDLLVGGSKAVAQPNVNATTIARFSLPVPPLAEQRRIVAEVERRLAALARVEAQVTAALEQTAQLRAALFHRALAGHLVSQNCRDEPAARLLEHIQVLKAERESRHKARRSYRVTKKVEVLAMLTTEGIKPTYLEDLLRAHGKPMIAKALWKESRLSIDDFYAQLKKEMGKGIREIRGEERLLEAKS